MLCCAVHGALFSTPPPVPLPVLLSRAEYDSLQETAYLLRVPANARYLLESLEQARRGQTTERDLSR